MSSYDLSAAQAHFAARLAFTTGVHELEYLVQQQPADSIVVDVRFPKDYAAGHVPGAINLPKGKWQNPKGLRKDATHYVYCYDQTCHMAVDAAVELTRQGYKVVEVEGGYDRWTQKGYRSESAAAAA
ncbi:MAG TPA: rhodanese-like domain-containing protein [Verrucomicrobiae bacterium]|nr:rhodanese-like domain-containing protein [Verrucomicrobiae bacterium]